MNYNAKISVIIPVYNVEKYLRECLENVIAQTYDNLEIIVVNDGSTDNSGMICEDFRQKDARIKYYVQENQGLSSARNLGIEQSTGDWLTFVDSDDVLDPDGLKQLFEAATAHDADLAVAPMVTFEGQVSFSHKFKKGTCLILSGPLCARQMMYQTNDNLGMTPSACAKLFRASLVQRFRFEENMLYEDLDLLPRLAMEANKVVALKHPIYYYRLNRSSILGKFNSKRFDVLKVCDRLVHFFSNDAELLRAAEDRRMSAAFNMLILMGVHGYKNEKVEARCVQIIKAQRLKSLINRKVRFKNKVGAIGTYIFGIKILKNRFLGKRLLSR